MKPKSFISVCLGLITLGLMSCNLVGNNGNNNSNTPANGLANTKWEGSALQTTLKVTFTSDECYIQASGYATGVAVGTYKISQSDLFVTITNTSGNFDGQLAKGDILIGAFDLNAKTMYIELTLYGNLQRVNLTLADGNTPSNPSDDPNEPATPTNRDELLVGNWHCNIIEEFYYSGSQWIKDTEYVNFDLTVNANHTFTRIEHAGSTDYTTEGRWALSGNTLSFVVNGNTMNNTIQELTNNKLTIRADSQSRDEYELIYFTR